MSFGDGSQGAVVVSVPHAGREYDDDIVRMLAVPVHRVFALEDAYADRLVESVVAEGVRVLVQRAPRLLIDVNRSETDFEPGDFGSAPFGRPSAKARGGLGVVPTRLAGAGALWKRPLAATELLGRITKYHRPYHHSVSLALSDAQRRFGTAVLLDVHSMPPLPGIGRAQVIVGDRHGATANTALVEAAALVFQRQRLQVAFNHPYAGGHIVERHASPARGIFALQIEIDRRLYLDERLEAPGEGLPRMTALIAELTRTLDETVTQALPLAAE